MPRPPAPYLIQAHRHPSAPGLQTIRTRIKAVSIGAGARRADGSPLILLPHDCRRVFASEHLNNNTPVHVIQALLGHASLDTVMIYAKLYPSQLIEEYRKTMRGLYNAHYGEMCIRDSAEPLKLDAAEVWVDPRAEWKQIYHEVWRIERDFLYDPHFHGLDLAAAEKLYSRYLDGIADRDDLNDLLEAGLGNLVLGHVWVCLLYTSRCV